ncbi:HlyD family efflux transporter periplasmic adaptor subunit [Candidatus Uhrbacteria bacterium]|nr:HlyD family efflux transporter periplasmic adaptor subunit [Candidatus Uhrbacteria bacterium]
MKQKKRGVIIVIFILLLGAGGWYYYRTTKTTQEPIRYITTPVSRGSLVVTVSGSGYTAANSRVDVKPKVSGDLETLLVQSGKPIIKDAVIATINNDAAQKELRDARLKLQNVRLSLKKLKEPPSALALLSAENAIHAAQRELEKLQKPPDQADIVSAQNSFAKAKSDYDALITDQELWYTKAKDTFSKSQEVLEKSRDDALTTVANVFLDLPSIKSGIESIASASPSASAQAYLDSYSDQVSPQTEMDTAIMLKSEMRKSFLEMDDSYAPALSAFNETNRSSSLDRVESLIDKTLQSVKAVSETLKRTKKYFDFVQNNFMDRKITVPTILSTQQSSVQGYIEDINTHLGQLLSTERTVRDNRLALLNAQRDLAQLDTSQPRAKDTARNTIKEKEKNLEKIIQGADEQDIAAAEEKIKEREETLSDLKKGSAALDIESQELSVRQSEIAVQDAQERLGDYTLKSPIAGFVAQVPVTRGESVSPSTILASIVTKKKIAEISLNEIDAARIALGMRATLTFDALPTLSLTGEVIEMDTIGTLEQGVVTYAVKIAFDTENPSVREGMSVTATILVDSRANSLIVPAASVQSEREQDFVQVFISGAPQRRMVRKGISNDTQTEILEGLNENDPVITQTIRADQEKTTNQNQPRSLFQTAPIGGQRGGGGFGGNAGGPRR